MGVAIPASFDIPTLSLVLAIVHLCCAVVTCLLFARRRSFPGARLWILGQFLLAAGAMYFAAGTLGMPLAARQTGATGAVECMVGILVAILGMAGYFLMSSARTERELRAREADTRRLDHDLADAVAIRDAMIAVIGHDLRSPAWSAGRYVRGHLVEFDGDLNSKRGSIETLAEGLERISGQLDSLLEWALCASGRTKLDSVTVSAGELFRQAASDVTSMAAAKSVSIEIPTGDGVIAADRRALATVLRNLLENAVKYSNGGSTVRTAIEQGHGPHGGRCLLVVEDDGVGMKPEQLAKLFIPGKTLLTFGTGREQGNGFGLATSKQFVERMGGTIRVESQVGQGTRIVLDFPIPSSR